MKLYILGPSGSGKTYVANALSKKLDINHTNLDYIFFKHIQDKSREENPEEEWRNDVSHVLSKKKWIIEGVNLVKEVLAQADRIIYLRPPFFVSFIHQWKRYFSDPKQRKEHGFINNLKLTGYILKQYFETPDATRMDNPKYSRVKKIDLMLQKYMGKTILLKNHAEVNNFINSF